MSASSKNIPAENVEAKVERATKAFSNVKTLATALITAAGVIFAAGVYYAELKRKLDDYLNKIDRLETHIASTQKSLSETQASLAMIEAKLYGTGDAIAAENGIKCPEGTYVVEVSPVSVSGGNRGYLESISVSCKHMHMKK